MSEIEMSPTYTRDLQNIANDVLGAAKMSFVAVASNPDLSTSTYTIEEDFQKLLADMPSEKQQKFKEVAQGILSVPESDRVLMFGRAANRDVSTHLRMGGFRQYEEGLKAITEEELLSSPVSINSKVTAEPVLSPDGKELQEDKIGLWVTSIHCVDRTDWEFSGDEIVLAGLVAEGHFAQEIEPTSIRPGLDSGSSKEYTDWCLVSFGLQRQSVWPKRIIVELLLAEKDNPCLEAFLSNLWQKIHRKVTDIATQTLSTTINPIIAVTITEAVSYVVDSFVKWLIESWQDDVFPLQAVSVYLPGQSARWVDSQNQWGRARSETRKVTFEGHGGKYILEYHWRFYS